MRGYPDYKRPRHPARAAAVRVLTIGLALAMPTAAIAATPLAGGGTGEPPVARDAEVAADFAVQEADDAVAPAGQTVAGRAAVAARELRAGSDDLLNPGPFHPLDGKPDYGDAEAAFGNARGRPHEGQDIMSPAGTTIVSPTDGTAIDSGYDSRGNWLAIYDPERDQTYNFFHMNAPALVKPGDSVEAGEKVGEVGCTGSCYGSHLHFEIRDGSDPYGTARDPLPQLLRWQRVPH